MSQSQVHNFRIIKQLMLELARFGLNPRDWRVQRKPSQEQNIIYLQHRSDADFRLYGRVYRETPAKIGFSELRIASI